MPVRISKNRVALENVPLNESKGADIASASTVNLDSATGNLVHITGTTTITAITLASGSERTVVFDAALTLTHNSTTLILPGSANITTAAGGAIFRGDGSGNVRCISYIKADGTAVSSPAAPTLQVFTSSGTWTKPSGCKKIKVTITGGGGSGEALSSGQGSSGGAGGTAIKFIDVTAVSSVSVTIGSGAAAVSPANSGNTGGTSSFGAYQSATGGAGGTTYGGLGGTASGGDINLIGGDGQSRIIDGYSNERVGGASYWGGGGNHRAGQAYGSGGSGNAGGGSSYAGAAGVCVVEEYY